MTGWWVDDASTPLHVLAALRSTERRSGEQDRFDTFYRFYITALISLFGFYLSLSLVDEATVDAAGVRWATTQAPLWVGVIAAVAIAAGVRSGINGGPLALDELEIHHVLSSPLPRSDALAAPTRRLILIVAGVGGVTGAAAGELTSRQLPGSQWAWVLSGLLTGFTLAIAAVGGALAAQGSPRRGQVMSAIAVVIPIWAVVDLATGIVTSPTSFYGKLALWPLGESWSACFALFGSGAVSFWGWRRIGAGSIERAHHRSRLVRQIRFAIAQQDLRSLLVLRRQLGFETPRNRPWLIVKGGGRLETRFPVLVRDVRSYLRWPLSRVARTAGLAVATGLAAAGLWHGTTALVAAVGVASYVAAIEVIEPLSQEFDHPGILELIPIAPGGVVLAHAISATVAMVGFWLVAGLVASAATLDWHLGATIAMAAIPAAGAAVAAAALSIKRIDSPTMVPAPEVEGPRLILRLLWPPILATTGALPILIARNSAGVASAFGPATINTITAVAVLSAMALAWIRFRDEVTTSVAPTQRPTK